jgi:hypothetical protein
MRFDWAATGVIITIIAILCGVFYRLGKLSESKADKRTCEERAESCANKFLIADQSVARLYTAVARVEEQQNAGAENLRTQIRITERLEVLVTKML